GVDDARGKRRLGADHREVDLVVFRKTHQRGHVGIGDRDVLAFGFRRRPRVSRRDEHAIDPRTLTKLPGQRVFATAAADYHDLHRENSCAAAWREKLQWWNKSA